MRIGVIGLGVSSAIFTINYLRSHPKDRVIIFEHLDKPLKKILATGNGKCNIANNGKIDGIYNSSFAIDILNKYDYKTQLAFLDSINIKTKEVNGLYYPISESAVTARNALLKALNKKNIEIVLNAKIEDYAVNDNNIDIYLDNGTYTVDKLVIAVGGKSSPNLGSDGSFHEILKEHRYNFKDIEPGLCPIETKESLKELDGVRVKCEVTLRKENKIIFKERGEVLFKKHGLSGIVIFNSSRLIAREKEASYTYSLDLLPDISKDDLGIFLSFNSPDTLLDSYLHPSLADYIKQEKLSGTKLLDAIKYFKLHFKALDSFEHSQVSVGGISLKNVNDKLDSKIEKGVYFIGEVLDVDAPCGGYNLMWAIGSGLFLGDYL